MKKTTQHNDNNNIQQSTCVATSNNSLNMLNSVAITTRQRFIDPRVVYFETIEPVADYLEKYEMSFLTGGSIPPIESFLLESSPNQRLLCNKALQLIIAFRTCECFVTCSLQLDDDTLLTGSLDGRLERWNIITCESLFEESIETCSVVFCLTRTKDKSIVMCGLENGTIEIRNTRPQAVIFSPLPLRWSDLLYLRADEWFLCKWIEHHSDDMER